MWLLEAFGWFYGASFLIFGAFSTRFIFRKRKEVINKIKKIKRSLRLGHRWGKKNEFCLPDLEKDVQAKTKRIYIFILVSGLGASLLLFMLSV